MGRQLGVDLTESDLRGVIEVDTRSQERLVGFLQEPPLLAIEVQFAAAVINLLDALEELRIQTNIVPVGRGLRSDNFRS